ncbi:hypothetical protein [Granulibacter bethesdensis]|uniref:hypothetical protein n=1 Tax=Granulibacter bethesdensis TaxID=364410 RepID=UPI0012FD9FA1|nr:hypothetical protein [Granulibacter bethesdensis]
MDSVLGASNALAQSLYADRVVRAFAMAGVILSPRAVGLVDAILGENGHPLIVAAAAQSVLELSLDPRDQRRLQRRLLDRAKHYHSPSEALMASECLAGSLLLADLPGASRPAVVAALDDLDVGDPDVILRRGALLAGIAWLWARSPDVEALLRRLSTNLDAGGQAHFELALIALDRALAAQDCAALLAGLEVSRHHFDAALQAAPEFVEAAVLSRALAAVGMFCSDDEGDLEKLLTEACNLAGSRRLELDRSSLRAWLRPRIDAEAAWWQLASALRGLSDDLTKRSWLRAVPVLEQIARLRRALVPLATKHGDQLRTTITERIADSFLREEGLRSHLLAWRDDSHTTEADRAEASALLEAVSAIAEARDPSNGASSEHDASKELSAISDLRLHGLTAIASLSGFNAPTERAFLAMDEALQGHPDYSGPVCDDVRSLVGQLILFLSHCLDVAPNMAKGYFDFLFETGGAKPLEIELQRACWHTLRLQANGFPQHQILEEVRDIAAGRADIAVVRPGWRMVVEIKRELEDASRDGIRKYLGQAATYELTGPRIGFLVVLDLVSQRGWPLTLADNCWVERIQAAGDSAARMVCVWRIPGARQPPSQIKTPIH